MGEQDPVEALKDELALFVTDLLRRDGDPVSQEFRAAVGRSIAQATEQQLQQALEPVQANFETLALQSVDTQRRMSAEVQALKLQIEALQGAVERLADPDAAHQARDRAFDPVRFASAEAAAAAAHRTDDTVAGAAAEAPGGLAEARTVDPHEPAYFGEETDDTDDTGDEGEAGYGEDRREASFNIATLPIPQSIRPEPVEHEDEEDDDEDDFFSGDDDRSSTRSFLFTAVLLGLAAALSIWTWTVLSPSDRDESEEFADPAVADTGAPMPADGGAVEQVTTGPVLGIGDGVGRSADPMAERIAALIDETETLNDAAPATEDTDLPSGRAASAVLSFEEEANAAVRTGWTTLMASPQASQMGSRLRTLVCGGSDYCPYDLALPTLEEDDEASGRLMQLLTRYLADETPGCSSAIKVDGMVGSRSVDAFQDIIACVEGQRAIACDPVIDAPCPPASNVFASDAREAWQADFWRWALAAISRA